MFNFFTLVFIIFFLNFNIVKSQKINIVRDAEIEAFLKVLSSPILKEAKINPDNINFYVNHDDRINAFVTRNYNIFITTELLLNIKNYHQIAAVIAHEVGHITGGHFSKKIAASKDSAFISILSSILAIGAYASGSSAAGTALLMGGQHIGKQRSLMFSRNQESFADQAAMKFIEKTGYSLKGLYDLLGILEKRQRLVKQNPYNLTHPLSKERRQIVFDRLQRKNLKIKNNSDLEKRFKLIQAKLIGFFLEEEIVEIFYPKIDESTESKYARTLKLYKKGEIKIALDRIEACIKLDPKNEYFYELKGQMQFESADFVGATNSFLKALELNKNEKYFHYSLGKSLYHSNNKKKVLESIEYFEYYKKMSDFPVDALHYLALSHAKVGNFLFSSISLTEKFLLLNDLKNAKLHLKNAKRFEIDDKVTRSLIDDLDFLIKQKEKL